MVAYADVMMILGIVVLAAAFPAAVGAFSRGRSPRGAAIAFLVGGTLVILAQMSRPGGYSVNDITGLFIGLFTGP